MNWNQENLLEAAHSLARNVCDFRSLPAAAREQGSVAWENMLWAIGDFERRYIDIFGEPPPDVTQYNGFALDDGTLVLQGERGVILSELVARTISIPDTDMLVVEIPGDASKDGTQQIAQQIKELMGSTHEGKPIIVLTNGIRLHSLEREPMTNLLNEIGSTANRVVVVAPKDPNVDKEGGNQ